MIYDKIMPFMYFYMDAKIWQCKESYIEIQRKDIKCAEGSISFGESAP